MLINGTKIAAELRAGYKEAVTHFRGRTPCLALIIVGSHPASEVYVKFKAQACEEVGIHSIRKVFPETMSEKELLDEVERLNRDEKVDGILVQLPLPAHINPALVMQTITPAKDVDGFHPINLGKLFMGETDGFVPCTPLGISFLLDHCGIDTRGKHAVVVGRSNIVGKPMAALLLRKGRGGDATVTVAHSQSHDIPALCRTADILIAAIGKPRYITTEMVKEGVVVIDVGINRVQGGAAKLIGDVDFENVKDKCAAITPVPGGVGPMTIAMLLNNTLKSYLQSHPETQCACLLR